MENIFSDDGSQAIMPDINKVDMQKDLMSDENKVYENMLGETVSGLLIPKEANINADNFIFDFTDVEDISIFQKKAIESLISSDGTVSLYLYKKNNLCEIGKGRKYFLDRVIPLIKVNVFNNSVRVYKDYCRGESVQEVTTQDITKFRLNL